MRLLLAILLTLIVLPALALQPAKQLQLRRGVCSALPTLADGEPAWCEDTLQLWIGTNTATNTLITGSSGITSLNAQMGNTQIFANDTNVIVTSSSNTHTLGWAGTLSMARGGTSANLSPVLGGVVYTNSTNMVVLPAGTSGQFLQSTGAGSPTWATAITSAITSLNSQTGATQVFANDTNFVITSSANTHTLGWSGTLSMARGGTGNGMFGVPGGVVYGFNSSVLDITSAGTSGQVLTSTGAGAPTWTTLGASGITTLNAQTGATQLFANDTNITMTSASNTHTLGWSGTLAMTRGGTGASLTGAAGGIPYFSSTTAMAVVAAGTSGQVLTSGGSGTPTWSSASSLAITSLNSQTGSTQIFANDTNVIITSASNTHTLSWSGTLATSRGGTGHGTFTTGSIPFSNGSILTEQNTKFYWDVTNFRLGVNQGAPQARIHANSVTTSGTVGADAMILGKPSTTANIGAGAFIGNGSSGGNVASGTDSTAFGNSGTSSGLDSFVANNGGIASNSHSSAFGSGSTASGYASFSTGEGSVAQGLNQFVVGQNNVAQGTANSFVSGDDTFIVGNGADVFNPANSFSVTNNGIVKYYGTTSGTLSQKAAASTTSYSLTWPSAQASGTKVLQNDGAGALSWASDITSLNSQTGATQIFVNDTNVIITSASNTHTLGWASTLSVARGGTGRGTAFTSGSVYFSNGSIATEDNANFFWDGTNHRLGIGTTSPTAKLHLPGSTINASTAPLKFASGTVMTSAEAGAVEYDGTNLHYTNGTPTRQRILSFPSGSTVNLGAIIYQSTTTAISQTAVGTAGQVLNSGGSGTPTWGQLTHDAEVSVTGVVSAEDSEWITGNCSLATSIFTCTLTTFATTPKCTATVHGTTSGEVVVNPTSSTSVAVATFSGTTGLAADRAFTIRCAAP